MGFSADEIEAIGRDVSHYEKVRAEVKIASGDYIDLKAYEPAMRHLIDTYIRAEDAEKIAAFDDTSLLRLIVERGARALSALPKRLRESESGAAEAIENNIRRLIVDERPINPKYYDKMSELLDELIRQRKQGAIEYQAYLEKMAELVRGATDPAAPYPSSLTTRARRALYDNLGKDEALALRVDAAIVAARQDDWRNHPLKIKKIKLAIQRALDEDEERADTLMEIVKQQHDY